MANHCRVLNHHPEWRNVFNHVTVALTTWDARRRGTIYDLNPALFMNMVRRRCWVRTELRWHSTSDAKALSIESLNLQPFQLLYDKAALHVPRHGHDWSNAPHTVHFSSDERFERIECHFLGKFLADTGEVLQGVHRIQLAHFSWVDTVQSHFSKPIEAEFGVVAGIEKRAA